MKAFLFLAAGLALMTFALPAKAQSDETKTFVKKAGISNLFEIRSSQVAINKGRRDDVREFAQMMIEDHTKAGNDLKKALSVSPLPIEAPGMLDEDHQEKINDLKKADVEDFDEDYIEAQIDAHEKAVSLFEDYAENGDDPALREFAANTLPVLRKHEMHIKKIEEKD